MTAGSGQLRVDEVVREWRVGQLRGEWEVASGRLSVGSGQEEGGWAAQGSSTLETTSDTIWPAF